jgi:hypothetical protein
MIVGAGLRVAYLRLSWLGRGAQRDRHHLSAGVRAGNRSLLLTTAARHTASSPGAGDPGVGGAGLRVARLRGRGLGVRAQSIRDSIASSVTAGNGARANAGVAGFRARTPSGIDPLIGGTGLRVAGLGGRGLRGRAKGVGDGRSGAISRLLAGHRAGLRSSTASRRAGGPGTSSPSDRTGLRVTGLRRSRFGGGVAEADRNLNRRQSGIHATNRASLSSSSASVGARRPCRGSPLVIGAGATARLRGRRLGRGAAGVGDGLATARFAGDAASLRATA